MSKKQTRKHRTPEEKVRILRLHLLEGMPISEVCDREGINPTQFYQWQKTFFEKGTAAFESGRSPSRVLGGYQNKIQKLEGKLQRKDEVIAEIMEDLIRTKKEVGES